MRYLDLQDCPLFTKESGENFTSATYTPNFDALASIGFEYFEHNRLIVESFSWSSDRQSEFTINYSDVEDIDPVTMDIFEDFDLELVKYVRKGVAFNSASHDV